MSLNVLFALTNFSNHSAIDSDDSFLSTLSTSVTTFKKSLSNIFFAKFDIAALAYEIYDHPIEFGKNLTYLKHAIVIFG